ncbi:MAG: VanW family protein [Lutisporaceae bacterium]
MKVYKLSKGGLIFTVVFLIFAIIVASTVALLSDNIIQPNMSISGIDVSGLTRYEAENRLKNIYEEKISEAFILLKFENKEWKIGYKDLAYSYNIEEAVDKAYSVGHTGDVFKRLVETVNARLKPHSFEVESKYNTEPIYKLIDQIAVEIDQDVIDATIRYKGKGFEITDETIGRILDKEGTLTSVTNQLHNVEIGLLELPVEIVEPVVKRADLAHVQDKLGEFSTKFNAADFDRTTNIKVATSSASHVLIRPGEVYSVNETIGPRLAKFGYKDAKVIINNELVPGIGGGVCQVSSTLYNAVLLSNLKIIERKNHTLTLSYVELGRDATISGDYIDFKFLNNTDYPIYIYGEVQGSWVKFTVFGKNENPGRTVKINSVIVKTIPPEIKIIKDATMPVGTEKIEKKAHTGYVVKTERIVYENGKEILREVLGNSNYRVVNGVTRVGTMPVAPPPVPNDPTVPTLPPVPPTPSI